MASFHSLSVKLGLRPITIQQGNIMARAGNRITKVTTKTGDGGTTSLADGSTIAKSSNRISVIGEIDELNSLVGLLVTEINNKIILGACEQLQQELFDIGGTLATKGLVPCPEHSWIEELIDDLNRELPSLKELIIPGGSKAASLAHVCRCVCRRAERSIWKLVDEDIAGEQETKLETDIGRYLNRLSDFFFLIARVLNESDGPELQWRGSTSKDQT